MKNSHLKLGIFFIGGVIILIAGLYVIGSRQNLFENNIEIRTYFSDAMGLQEGSGVRFMGISIGSVEQVSIINDTLVAVSMKIDETQAEFIKKDALAIINSDGLMGNKLITILPGSASTGAIRDGDEIQSKKPVGIENVMVSVLENSRNLEKLTNNLIDITNKVKSGEGLAGKLIYDSSNEKKFDTLIAQIDKITESINSATSNIDDMSANISGGKGTLGRLIYDTTIMESFVGIIDTLSNASSEINTAAVGINSYVNKLNNGKGSLSRLVNDTSMAENLDETIKNARLRTAEIEETIDIVNDSWILNLFSGRKKNNKKEDAEW